MCESLDERREGDVLADLKPGVPQEELNSRIKTIWQEIKNDPRTRQWKDGRGLNGKEMYQDPSWKADAVGTHPRLPGVESRHHED